MAKLEIGGIAELNAALGRLGDIPWDVMEDVLGAMAEVAESKVKSEGETMGIRDPDSSVHILDHITSTKAKQTRDGGRQDVTFSGSRTRSGISTRNAEIAFINEFGKRGQPARPFIKSVAAKYEQAITDPGAKVLMDWFEKEFIR